MKARKIVEIFKINVKSGRFERVRIEDTPRLSGQNFTRRPLGSGVRGTKPPTASILKGCASYARAPFTCLNLFMSPISPIAKPLTTIAEGSGTLDPPLGL